MPTSLPPAFVWTKMGAESGEALDRIIQRKEFERRLGDGTFCWGIGNALGNSIDRLAAEFKDPTVWFSPMPSRPKKIDESPESVLLWTAFVNSKGEVEPLPAHVVVTSRGGMGDASKQRHYALFCSSSLPIDHRVSEKCVITPTTLRNFSSGTKLGASQVTAVVQQFPNMNADGRQYEVAFSANLTSCMYARLANPAVLARPECDVINQAAQRGLSAWESFVFEIRARYERLGCDTSTAQAALF